MSLRPIGTFFEVTIHPSPGTVKVLRYVIVDHDVQYWGPVDGEPGRHAVERLQLVEIRDGETS
jgi:hypothetical protein